MTSWTEFAGAAPRIAATFVRRHNATGNLCLLGTTRRDGYPRISPIEPRLYEGHLWLVGMPGTVKFRDLRRDPRFCLHTATTDPQVGDGDAKLWGEVYQVDDVDLQRRWTAALYADTGFDLRGQDLKPFFAARITGASAVEVGGGHLDVVIWKPGSGETMVRKH